MGSRRDNDESMYDVLMDVVSEHSCYICASRPRRSGFYTCSICGFGRNDVVTSDYHGPERYDL